MRIESIDLTYLDFPLVDTFYPSWIPGLGQQHNRSLLIELKTDEGPVGRAAQVLFDEHQARLLAGFFKHLLGAFLLGADPTRIDLWGPLIENAALMFGLRPWPLEIALWDLLGQQSNRSLASLLGGGKDRLAVYASSGAILPIPERLAWVEKIQAMGFQALKLRAKSDDWRDDVKVVEAVRKKVGPSFPVLVDANQGWSLSPMGPHWSRLDALGFAREMDRLGVVWLEEPLDRFDYEGLKWLADQVDVAIAGGEMNQGIHEFKILAGALDVVQPDATLAGGVRAMREVAALCKAHGKWYSPHTWTNGWGFAVNAQIASALSTCPWLEYPFEPPAWVPEARDFMLQKPFLVAGGEIEVPSGPGVGVEFNPAALRKYGTKIE